MQLAHGTLLLAYSMEGCTELVLNMHYMYSYKENPNNKTEKPLGLHNFWIHQHKWLQQMLLPQRSECVSVGRNGSLLKVGSGLHVCHSKPGGHYCCTEVNR